MSGFAAPALSAELLADLEARRTTCVADIVRLTSLAASGHPGGSLSTLDALLVLYACANISPDNVTDVERDRILISHGHISPGVYSTLASFGFFDINDAYVGFRSVGSAFGGHIETVVPGVEWNTGNLGQGLSAACGFAMAARLQGSQRRVFCGMGDGEQQKGQITEARRFAVKFGLTNLVAFIDVNGLQIGGKTEDIMPFDLRLSWESDGWNVVEVDGHDFNAIYEAFRPNPDATRPTVVFLRTVMGKGIPFIENKAKYHGQALSDAEVAQAFEHLGIENNFEALRKLRKETPVKHHGEAYVNRNIDLDLGTPCTYGAEINTDCRSAYGNALNDLAVANKDRAGSWPIVGISCDLEGSVKMNDFHKTTPERFLEIGISEHHAAVLAGALSKDGIVPFYSTFGMFAVAEGYNQQRLNDQNETAPKVVMTHCGLDVGEDGPTHQAIDYVSLLRNLFGWEIYCPADPNETDRIVRVAAGRYAPTCVAMGRSKLPVITSRDGQPLLAGDFVPGKWVEVRPGNDAVVFAYGVMVYRAIEASDALAKEGINLRVVNASSLQPFDRDAIIDAAKNVGRVLTYEDHNVNTGLGAIVAGVVADEGLAVKLRRMGVSKYSTSGKPDDLFAAQGLSPADLAEAVRKLVG